MVNHIQLWIYSLACLFTLTFVSSQPASGSCRHGWVLNGTSCYLFVEQQEVWSNALSHCRSIHGASLAEITEPKEEDFIKNYFKKLHPKDEGGDTIYWLGGSDFEFEGEWRWAGSDEIIEYYDWAPGQPDDYQGGEDCMEIHRGLNYQWDDRPCNQLHRFICEAPAMFGSIIG